MKYGIINDTLCVYSRWNMGSLTTHYVRCAVWRMYSGDVFARFLHGPVTDNTPDSKVHGANIGPIWGRQDPAGPHVGPMKFAIWDRIMPGKVIRIDMVESSRYSKP